MESLNRQEFAQQLQRSWQRLSEERLPDGTGFYNFTFTRRITGRLPALSADFSHIAHLELHGYGASHGLDAFLHSFPIYGRCMPPALSSGISPPLFSTCRT
ncbi:hypothetical protein QNM99_18415 [Pseudomonas sp. PCH446]